MTIAHYNKIPGDIWLQILLKKNIYFISDITISETCPTKLAAFIARNGLKSAKTNMNGILLKKI